MKKIFTIIAATIGVWFLFVTVASCCAMYSMAKALETKTDPALYANIVKQRKALSVRYAFLPPEVPCEATKVAFFHIPHFLQGGDVVILRLTLPSNRIEAITAELEKSGRKEIPSLDGDADIPPPYAYPDYGIKKPTKNNMFEGVGQLPKHFRVFLFNSDLNSIKQNWDHNALSFTAVSGSANEVVYYVDVW